jgi:hypothetical protein
LACDFFAAPVVALFALELIAPALAVVAQANAAFVWICWKVAQVDESARQRNARRWGLWLATIAKEVRTVFTEAHARINRLLETRKLTTLSGYLLESQ